MGCYINSRNILHRHPVQQCRHSSKLDC
uniref:Uncharacterized protein n=1 Tax=Anguilla anguilla TaxID=7936 RepID=A0A0E9S737_ANGAN